MRITVFDEDRNQRVLLLEALTAAGHSCDIFDNAKVFLNHLKREKIDLLILHCQPTETTGIDALHWANEHSPMLPFLFIASATEEDTILAGLAAGADDYLIKPLRRAELLSRVEVQLRRAYPSHNPTEHDQFGKYLFESRGARLTVAGKAVELTKKEFDLALLFFRNIGRPLSRATIQETVWAQELLVTSRTIDTHVSRVRGKLGLRPENGYKLAPVYSFGYQLEKMKD